MDLTTLLSQYASLLCNLDKINDFLSKINCLSDGSFEVKINNCCFNVKALDIYQILSLIELSINSDIIEELENLPQEINLDDNGYLPGINDDAECACEQITEMANTLQNFFNVLTPSVNNLKNALNGANVSLDAIETNTDPIKELQNKFQTILDLLEEPYVVKTIPYTEYYFDGHIGTYSFVKNAFDPSNPPVQDILNLYSRDLPNVQYVLQLDELNDSYVFAIPDQSFQLIYGLSGCYQRIALLWSDGTYTDKDGNSLNPTTVGLQENAGYCYAGILPNTWNTEYTDIS